MTDVDELVSDLREKYRRALQQGVLDSHEDFGLRYLRGRDFPSLLEEYPDPSEKIS